MVTGETKMWLEEREARERAEREVVRLKELMGKIEDQWERSEKRLSDKLAEQMGRAESEANRASDWKTVSGLLSVLVGVLVYFLSRR